jgi:hypothetical protein
MIFYKRILLGDIMIFKLMVFAFIGFLWVLWIAFIAEPSEF